jgi:hypothetical protein
MKALCLACLAGFALVPAQDAWKPAEGPLKTRWAKDVSPEKALPEYPRPQMVRRDWLNLNGLWDYAIRPKEEGKPEAFDGKILVPFPVESALSGVMKMVGEKNRLWYRRTFEVPAGWAGKRVLLHFGAVDWEAAVSLNGKELGTHRGGYDGFGFDLTDALKAGGAQELVLSVWDPSDGGSQPRGKQVRKPGGIFYVPATGIWQTAWLEPVPEARIERLVLVPDVDAGALKATVEARGGGEVELVALDGGKEVGRAAGKAGEAVALKVPEAKLWTPETPFLYDLKVTLKSGDAVDSYFGMRKIALGKDEKGVQRLMLNGKPVFHMGPLDQGFWPDGIYTAPTDEALRYDIEITKKLGFNATRKHVKVEPLRWYAWCDRLGLLVWQDMPSGNNKGDEARQQYEKELKALIDGLISQPCIVMWVVFNEGWGQYDTERLTKWTKDYDPSRLVNNASGWTDKKVGDVIDMHSYPGPGSPRPEESRAAVLGEFGGLGLPVEGHMWTQKHWGYQGMSSPKALTQRYLRLLQKVWTLKDEPGLCAAIYTQITDVETEANGLLTYDRAVIKVDLEKVASANRGKIPPAPPTRVVVPTARDQEAVWRYTLEKPADDWKSKDFDASSWKEGKGGFGTEGTPGAVVRTEWKTSDIWLRREFTLPEEALVDPLLLLHHDEDAEVFINGIRAAKAAGFTTEYEEVEIDSKARATLKPGRNVIAVYCKQTKGGQYIDLGILDTKP